MNRYFIVFFMIVGVADLLYGIFSGDRISIFVGGGLTILTIYVARKQWNQRKNERDTPVQSP